jgi:phosphoenolpyruvate synthase/pyruvate phosphate dikinase
VRCEPDRHRGFLRRRTGGDAPATLERASEQIQSVIAQGTIPGDIAEMIRQRYANLGADAPVAVRSSATAEDLPEMSFAGQLETYLNVRGGDGTYPFTLGMFRSSLI